MRRGDLFWDFLVYNSPNPIDLLSPCHEPGLASASPLLIRVVHLGGDVLCMRTKPGGANEMAVLRMYSKYLVVCWVYVRTAITRRTLPLCQRGGNRELRALRTSAIILLISMDAVQNSRRAQLRKGERVRRSRRLGYGEGANLIRKLENNEFSARPLSNTDVPNVHAPWANMLAPRAILAFVVGRGRIPQQWGRDSYIAYN